MSDGNSNRCARGDEQLEGQTDTSRHPKSGAADMDAITSLTVREQVDALAQALLREFMHRRGYTKTLQTFDRECPRNERTIASRQLMRQLLEIPSHAFPSRLSGDGGTDNAATTASGEGEADDKKSKRKKKKAAPTYMEELCSYRLQKREVQQRRREEAEKTEADVDTAPTTIIDPSDAEMEEWRTAAVEKERCIAETRERHERLLRERRERKHRKREKRRKKQEKKGRKQKEGETSRHRTRADDEGDGGDMTANAHGSGSQRHGKRHPPVDDASDGDDDPLLRPANAKAGAAPRRSHRGDCGDGGHNGGTRGGLAEPEFLLGRLDRRREQRPTGHAVGSHWTPCGGNVTEVLGSCRAAPFSPDTPALSSPATASPTPTMNSDRPPSFLVGEGMSLMSERMQAAKRQSALEDCLPSSPSPPPSSLMTPASAILGGGGRGMRGGAGFFSLPSSRVLPKPLSREGSPGAPAPAFHYTTAGQHIVSHGVGGRPQSPPPSPDGASSVTVPPPPSGILKTSSSSAGHHGFDGKARPASSALRKGTTSTTDKNGDGAAGANNGGEREQSSGRKNRKVTILVD